MCFRVSRGSIPVTSENEVARAGAGRRESEMIADARRFVNRERAPAPADSRSAGRGARGVESRLKRGVPMAKKLQVGVLASGGGTNLQALLDLSLIHI